MGGTELRPAGLPAPGAGLYGTGTQQEGFGPPSTIRGLARGEGPIAETSVLPATGFAAFTSLLHSQFLIVNYFLLSDPVPCGASKPHAAKRLSRPARAEPVSVSLRPFNLPNALVPPCLHLLNGDTRAAKALIRGKLCTKQEINEGMMMMTIMIMIMVIQPFGREEFIFEKKILPSDALKILISF